MGLFNPPREPLRGVRPLLALHATAAHPVLPPGWRYLLMCRPRELYAPHPKPMAFHDISALARHLHRRRGQAGLQLQDAALQVSVSQGGWTFERVQGVSVWTLDPVTQDRDRYLGWAWVNGASRITLEAALQAEQPAWVH